MHYFCTYFDKNYIPRGLALYYSIQRNIPDFKLWILCMDDPTFLLLKELNLPNIDLLSLNEFEKNDPELLAAKSNRSLMEYYWTCTPSLPLYILEHESEIERIFYIDADHFFFDDPTAVFKEAGEASIMVIEHRFPALLQHLAKVVGKYNVGFLGFRKDEQGMGCLHWWRERCLEWCYYRHEDGKFGDQKYLDRWPEMFPNLVVLQHPGFGLAPWNLKRFNVQVSNKGKVFVDEQPLILYHFHGIKQAGPCLYGVGELQRISFKVRQFIYKPYLKCLIESAEKATSFATENISVFSSLKNDGPNERQPYFKQCRRSLSRFLRISINLIKGKYLIIYGKNIF